ncbi:hypothetical protein X759_32770 [Mesorhizobium sp. LSHC420B00]|nr:hypothetical protein X759_32770 [Mesorhizobium sp. LSHC420B00]
MCGGSKKPIVMRQRNAVTSEHQRRHLLWNEFDPGRFEDCTNFGEG